MAISQIAAGEQISVARPKWNALIDAANAQQYATVAAMAAATSGLASGDVVRVAQGYNSEAETFRIVASGTFTANGAEVVALAVSGVQAVSTRTWFKSLADMLADTRTHTTGTVLEAIGVASFEAVASGGDFANAASQNINLVAVYPQPDRDAATAAILAQMPDGTIVEMAGLKYLVDSTATGADSATNDLSIDGLIPHGTGYPDHYGARGNGVFLDTAACQAWAQKAVALALRSGRTYLVSDTISVPAGKWIAGNRATVTASAAFDLFDFENGGGIHSARLVGSSGAGVYDIDGIGVVARGTNNHPAAPTYIAAPDVIDCDISGFGGYGVYFAYCKTGNVSLNRIYDCGYTGVGGISCEDVAVHSNIIEDITPGSAGGDAYGCFLDRSDGLSETSDPRSYRCSISLNTINRVTATGGNGQAIDTHAGVDFNIVGNVVQGCQCGIFITSSVIGALGQQLGPKRVVVSGNTVSGDTGYGIFVGGAQISGSVIDAAEDCVVTGNTVAGYGVAGDAVTGAVMLQGTENCKVTANVIKEPRANGVLLNLSNIGFDVSGNTIVDPWDNSYAAPNCIRVASGDSTGFIGGNVFRFEDAGLGTYVAVNAVRIESGLTGLDIDFGKNQFVGLDATHLALTLLTTTGVRKDGCAQQSGSVAVNITSGDTTGLQAVTFPKRMPYIPRIALTAEFQSGTRVPILISAGLVSATGFTCYVESPTTFSTTKSVNIIWDAY